MQNFRHVGQQAAWPAVGSRPCACRESSAAESHPRPSGLAGVLPALRDGSCGDMGSLLTADSRASERTTGVRCGGSQPHRQSRPRRTLAGTSPRRGLSQFILAQSIGADPIQRVGPAVPGRVARPEGRRAWQTNRARLPSPDNGNHCLLRPRPSLRSGRATLRDGPNSPRRRPPRPVAPRPSFSHRASGGPARRRRHLVRHRVTPWRTTAWVACRHAAQPRVGMLDVRWLAEESAILGGTGEQGGNMGSGRDL